MQEQGELGPIGLMIEAAQVKECAILIFVPCFSCERAKCRTFDAFDPMLGDECLELRST